MLRRLTSGAAALLTSLIVASALLPAAASAAARTAPVPAGFVGVNLDGPGLPTAPGVSLTAELAQMKRDGVQRVRVIVSWAAAQPYAAAADVPADQTGRFVSVDGVPTDWSATDAIVSAAARQGIAVLPIVMYAPGWDSTGASASTLGRPARSAPYAAFLSALVRRYGTHGSFWSTAAGRQKLAVTQWQIWNEPEIPYFWPTQPFAASYVGLLKAAHNAVKAADPRAQVVLAGLTGASWQSLAKVYAVPGARAAFDIVASHPYTAQPAGVITILRYDRIVMANHGDAHKPLIADEVGWTSSAGHVHSRYFTWGTTPAGQARQDSTLVALLAADRRALGLTGFDLYTWASTDTPTATSALGSPGFNYAGLEYAGQGGLVAKPALSAFVAAVRRIER